jgi:hypothetical protein
MGEGALRAQAGRITPMTPAIPNAMRISALRLPMRFVMSGLFSLRFRGCSRTLSMPFSVSF